MNLLQALAATPLHWSLQSTLIASDNPRRADTLVPGLALTVIPEPGAAPLVRHFHLGTPLDVTGMLVRLMTEQMPAHPVLRAWLDSQGNVPVQLEAYAMANVSECMHTALRKLADSPQSGITWNALHHLHAADWEALWQAVRAVLTGAFEGRSDGAPPVLRRQLAMALKEAVLATLDARRVPERPGQDDSVRRSKLEQVSLTMLHLGCQLTELDEWMWGWLGYVLKDAAPATAEA
jgi:hypothetical protein